MEERAEKLEMLIEQIDSKNFSEIKEILINENPADIASFFEELETERLVLLFRLLPKDIAAETFVEMPSDLQEHLIKSFSDMELKEVLDELYLDDAVDIVEEMPANVVKRILKTAAPDMRKMINELLKYPDDSAGSIMTIEYISLRPSMTVEEAIKRIRRVGVDKETIYTCYVTEGDRKLIGLVTVKDLLLAEEDTVISDIMETNIISVRTTEDQEVVSNIFSKYDFMAVPVTDEENRLVGIITFDDAIDVMQDEATEDIEKMAAIMPTDKTYLKTSVFELWKARIPWLLLLMISATFTGKIMRSFEDALAAQVVLTAFIPMLMDTAGNSGGQTSVTIIRGLSLGEIEMRDLLKIIWKEIRVAVFCGVTLAGANFVKILLVDRVSIEIALVVSLTIIITVIFAKITGATLPVLAKQLKFDPAVMSSPFITTIVDAIALLVYFNIAAQFLNL